MFAISYFGKSIIRKEAREVTIEYVTYVKLCSLYEEQNIVRIIETIPVIHTEMIMNENRVLVEKHIEKWRTA